MSENIFNIEKFYKRQGSNLRYNRQLEKLRLRGLDIKSIEQATEEAIKNIETHQSRSFVIYGEPQSGKTELMITLTAKLIDEGRKIIIILLNDSVQLLTQNLDRFIRSGIDPSPKNYSEILDPSVKIGDSEWIIFSKKNSKDLKKLIEKLDRVENKIIIDDEADYASPNSKVNKGEQTKINELVEKLLGTSGIYIGVTATPARLDLNDTFENNNERWVDFPPHPNYTGQDIFFPSTISGLKNIQFKLNQLPETGDDPKFLREAFFSFLVNVSFLNEVIHKDEDDKNFSMLIHTSGKKADHTKDYAQIIKILNTLKNREGADYEKYIHWIWNLARERYVGNEDSIAQYIVNNISRSDIVVMNSDIDKKVIDFARATNPAVPFTIAIGGNIVSRGVTFDNLLSMFFTRDAKHKIQQDTYIQRARMFGSRKEYLKYFELSIPSSLYADWQKCFIFHRLSLSAVKSGKGSPVWLEDRRISSVSKSSINKTIISLDSGEMGFGIFEYSSVLGDIVNRNNLTEYNKLEEISKIIKSDNLHSYLLDFIKAFSPNGDESLVVHNVRDVDKNTDYHDSLERPRGIFGSEASIAKYPKASHHIMIVRNTYNKARLIYKYVGNIKTLQKIRK